MRLSRIYIASAEETYIDGTSSSTYVEIYAKSRREAVYHLKKYNMCADLSNGRLLPLSESDIKETYLTTTEKPGFYNYSTKVTEIKSYYNH